MATNARPSRLGLAALLLSACLPAAVCAQPSPTSKASESAPMAGVRPAEVAVASPWTPPAEEDAVYRDATATAIAYIRAHRSAKTGLVAATPGWANITLWDVGSLVGAVYAAGELGLLDQAERDEWMGTLLQTLRTAPIVDNAAFNRAYVVATAGMLGDKDVASDVGTGWSTTDLGRLLIWLKVVETKLPAHAAAAREAVQRIDFGRIVQGGYLRGATIKPKEGLITYGEGRLGYEQYAARGFELWGHSAARSLDASTHARPVTVMGQTLLHDDRGGTTSSPASPSSSWGWSSGTCRRSMRCRARCSPCRRPASRRPEPSPS
ncbi:MAG: DUF3131 domain-containing protein [Gemmatimonadetes bacterium]|nr:DUF3131 domain-containing protein [Gemmatimonadota bacterium]